MLECLPEPWKRLVQVGHSEACPFTSLNLWNLSRVYLKYCKSKVRPDFMISQLFPWEKSLLLPGLPLLYTSLGPVPSFLPTPFP